MTLFSRNELNKLEHKIPFFLFSKENIKSNFDVFQGFPPGSELQYAMKANSEIEVLQTLQDAGSGFEVASSYELDWLKDLNVPATKINYGTSVKPIQHIRKFVDYGVDRIAVDSLPELEKVATHAPNSRVYIRIIVNDSGSIFKFSEKFGPPVENVVFLLKRARELGLQPYGISFHVGSQASNPRAWANAIETLAFPLLELLEIGIEIKVINIGGGFPCFYESSIRELCLPEIKKSIDLALQQLPYQPKLILEPGRAIVASSAVLITSVIGRVKRETQTWLFLDAGTFNALYEAMAFQGNTRYRITPFKPSKDSGQQMYALAGPTGDSTDVISREVYLPNDLKVGDKLIIHDVGAYSTAVTSRFNGFPKTPAYFI